MKDIKNFRAIAILLALIAVVLFIFLQIDPSTTTSGKCGRYRNDKTIVISTQTINAEVVITKKEQATGLSNRPCIEPNQAMMFIFDKPGQYAIWMKEMKFPIDVLWVSQDKKVVGIEKSVEPSTYPDSFANKDQPAIYVIELKKGRIKELGVKLGTKVEIK